MHTYITEAAGPGTHLCVHAISMRQDSKPVCKTHPMTSLLHPCGVSYFGVSPNCVLYTKRESIIFNRHSWWLLTRCRQTVVAEWVESRFIAAIYLIEDTTRLCVMQMYTL